MPDCIFCAIAAGEIPVEPVYSDDVVIAFDDIAPQAPVHTLVIPRAHFESLNDDIPPQILSALLAGVSAVARIKGISESGYRTIINTGPQAGQTVPHLHAHVLGGRPMAAGMVVFDDED